MKLRQDVKVSITADAAIGLSSGSTTGIEGLRGESSVSIRRIESQGWPLSSFLSWLSWLWLMVLKRWLIASNYSLNDNIVDICVCLVGDAKNNGRSSKSRSSICWAIEKDWETLREWMLMLMMLMTASQRPIHDPFAVSWGPLASWVEFHLKRQLLRSTIRQVDPKW